MAFATAEVFVTVSYNLIHDTQVKKFMLPICVRIVYKKELNYFKISKVSRDTGAERAHLEKTIYRKSKNEKEIQKGSPRDIIEFKNCQIVSKVTTDILYWNL